MRLVLQRAVGWLGWLGWLPVGLPGLAGAETPTLAVELEGEDTIEISVIEAVIEEGWVLQHSYNGKDWWDLGMMDENPVQFSLSSAPTDTRLFRAAKKPLATGQEALTQARERWAAGGLMNYQYRSRTSVGGFLTDDLTLVVGGELKEATSLLPPGFPGFSWGEQTIEDLFDRLQRAIDGKAYVIEVRYHPEWGYPETAYVDEDERIADEEWGVSIIEPPSDPQSLRAEGESRWTRGGVESYEFDLRYETAGTDWQGRIRVDGGSAEVVLGGEPLHGHIIMTMPEYFAYLGAALSEGKVASAAYHSELGYPLFFSRDWHLTQQNGPGERFWISGFRAVGGP